MPIPISRRDFLKLSALSLGSLAFSPNPRDERQIPDHPIARIAVDRQTAIYREPHEHSWVVRWTLQDELLNIYYTLTPPEGPAYNPFWYRVWEGYIHSAYVQTVSHRYNTPLDNIPENGQLAEITIPYTRAFQYSRNEGWQPHFRLYYETTHWIKDVVEGPDGIPYYHILEDKWDLEYYVPAAHLRVLPANELTVLSPEVPSISKRIEVRTSIQTVIAYEYNKPVFMVKAATGADFSTGKYITPPGHHITNYKRPSRHMAAGNLAYNGYDLPGVPWIIYITESGIAFHGTYWHNDFGKALSHGCINLPSKASKWLYRWTLPHVPYNQQSAYNVSGTHVDIME